MSKDVLHKYVTDDKLQRPGSSSTNDCDVAANGGRQNDKDIDKKSMAKQGWVQRDSGFNKTETDDSNNCNVDAIAICRPTNKLLKNEKKPRPTANPTKVCLKPEVSHESKEQFAQRIKQAWIDREQSKSCINIYLARNVIENPLVESIDQAQQQPPLLEDERDSCRTALEVQLQNHGAHEGDNSLDDSSEEEKPLSAAARRVRFYKTVQQQNDRQTLTRAMSAPASRLQSVQASSTQYSSASCSRRKSQEIHRFPTRKLKSCRSKAFHKSIDVDNRLPNGQKFGKKNQNVEVVTMMSLLSPVGSDAEESQTPDGVSTKTVTFPQFNNNVSYHQKSFDSAMQPVGKPSKHLVNNRVGKSLIKSRTLELLRDEEDDDGVGGGGSGGQGQPKDPVEISKRHHRDGEGDVAVGYDCDVVDGQPMFKSDKEKECWTLFKKMTAKGVSVTFDTVLRGMLTPTEYRLRKNELLSFG